MVIAVRTERRRSFFIRFKAAREGRQSIKERRTKDITPPPPREGLNKRKPIRSRVFKMEELQERALDKKRTDFSS